ncbi:hypothetical protein FCT18_14645 [Lysinibacillus sphaericus]|uniref:Uncharacterized protein n=1 Tax=Lysinibacillus sphaericus TaxID=1421 RepID=A0A2S0K661_LYSSH|nr:hypothetical protein [Lysinibacillus sphaericus]AVK98865.1 hypothetical protein LS41612_22525 [Lysinibacillus sphaericus]MED4545272.1 hypothetical protein [Lysinibacillus sphaericus]TKI18334.1 hypothetical protein FCT18_14645 [Lysinibacillus sphaericus]SUV15116.1 Uncharacterised protein [Lysinibacillus sphaericus]GEC82223.1 hypothetical protein LSP03_19660 [Lysinibacillus sphaericus]
MTESKWRKGDIILNRYGRHLPGKYFIYVGFSGRHVIGLDFADGKCIKKCQYHKSCVNEMLDGEPAFQVVGHTNAFDVMKQDLLKFIEGETT